MQMENEPTTGSKRLIDGQWRIYYDGYWIKAYEPPADTLLAKKRLIEALTRRLFNHVEHGLNIPGVRLEEARRAYEAECEPRKKRVKGAMLAGAMFNRAADVFTKVVEIQALGIEIEHDNALMRQCGEYLKEALALGKMVFHRSGEEGIDELWGEPFKAFAFPIEDFYKSRYIKIAQTMRAIDQIGEELVATVGCIPVLSGIEPLIQEFAQAAKSKCETLHTDAEIFDIWASFVAASERLSAFEVRCMSCGTAAEQQRALEAMRLLCTGKDLVSHIVRARVPMPKTTRDFLDRCQGFRAAVSTAATARAVEARTREAERGLD